MRHVAEPCRDDSPCPQRRGATRLFASARRLLEKEHARLTISEAFPGPCSFGESFCPSAGTSRRLRLVSLSKQEDKPMAEPNHRTRSRSLRRTTVRSKSCSSSSKRERRRPQGKARTSRLPGAFGPRADRGGDLLPGLRRKVEEDLLKESYVEHDAAKVLIAEIEAGERRGGRILRRQGEGAAGRNRAPRRGRGAAQGPVRQARRARSTWTALGDQLAARKRS